MGLVGLGELGFLEAQAGELDGAGEVSGAALVMDGELLAGVESVAGIGYELLPEGGGCCVVAAAAGANGEVAVRQRTKLGGKAGI